MKDERIQAAMNRCAARGFLIWYALILISLFYRMLILKQHTRDFWDIFAIWLIGTSYVCIAYAAKGVFAHEFKRYWITIGISVVAGILTMNFIVRRIHSVVDVGTSLIASSAGVGLVIGIAYLFNRRWKRKEGIEDEK